MSQRDSFIFYRSFFEATKPLKKNDKAELFDAICNFALDHKEPSLDELPKAMFALIQPQLEANYKKYLNGVKPKQKKSKEEAKEKQTISKREGNVNDNDNVNLNDNNNANNNIPTKRVFIDYAVNTLRNINRTDVGLKYDYWVANGWHSGGDNSKPISNWQSLLISSMKYMKKDSIIPIG